VLDAGSVIARGTPQAVADDPVVIAAYIGAPVSVEPTATQERALIDDQEEDK
jgi:hypothetical protein